jgi:SAM-dependent methyltransferase
MDVVRGTKIDDWNDWHAEYEDPNSELAGRARGVQRNVTEVVAACPPGPVTVVSICGGQGRELIGALADHPRRDDVRGRLVELDPNNAAYARRTAAEAGIGGLEIVNGDASVASAYDGLAPVDLVVISGLFGHVDDDDQGRLIEFVRTLLPTGGVIVWTFFARARRRTERLRAHLIELGFDEERYEVLPGEEYRFSVGLSRHRLELLPRPTEERIFTFGSSHPKETAPETAPENAPEAPA